MSTKYLAAGSKTKPVPLHPVAKDNFDAWLKKQDRSLARWVKSAGFEAAPGTFLPVPDGEGGYARVIVGVGGEGPYVWAPFASVLPRGTYTIDADLGGREANDAALGWALGTYEFTRYRKAKLSPSTLMWPDGADRDRVTALAEAIFLARDLINTPASDMGPAELAGAAKDLAKRHGAKITVTQGRALEKGFPSIFTVGKASSRAPRLVDLVWGKANAPKLTLVGKGVCFDTGGLDLKPASSMLMMKKDMGGAATVLGLAHAIMAAKLPVRLRVLIPAVENSVSGEAYRPLDVIETRKGLTVEVGNTDAEGRIVLADALALADEEKPELIVDVATLTGAARVALGTELPALFANDDESAAALLAAGVDVRDRLWRMPLHDDYRRLLDSSVADMNNVSNGPYAGAITAALFLREFVSKDRPWMHIDTMAWNLDGRPGRPSGGEPFGLRALFEMAARRFGRAGAGRAAKKRTRSRGKRKRR